MYLFDTHIENISSFHLLKMSFCGLDCEIMKIEDNSQIFSNDWQDGGKVIPNIHLLPLWLEPKEVMNDILYESDLGILSRKITITVQFSSLVLTMMSGDMKFLST